MVPPRSSDQDLLSTATTNFDTLLRKGQLFWEESQPEYVTHDGFQFEFRIIPSFSRKPLPPKGAKRPAKGKDPFLDPEDGFVVTTVGSTHVLQFNKYCIYRPQFLLHTKEFARQTEDLDLTDFVAGLDVLKQLDTSTTTTATDGTPPAADWVLFYNCGLRAGSSQGHKHMQLVPKPRPQPGQQSGFQLFPDRIVNKDRFFQGFRRPPAELHVPYDSLVAAVGVDASAQELYDLYQGMLGELRTITRVMSGEQVSGAHNMVMTLDWICVIPRQSRGEEGVYTNAMGMMGLVWVQDKAEREGWNKLHLTDELRAMGFPTPVQVEQIEPGS